MAGSASAELTLPALPRTVGQARRAVRQALVDAGGTHLLDAAQLVVSELVTNAVVHAGTDVTLRITAESDAIRVEIEDSSPHLPVRRTWSRTAGTGRGLMIVEEHADRWSAVRTNGGKVVWFEIGRPATSTRHSYPPPTPAGGSDAVEVVLQSVPLLMHWAWQEHAAALLREYLLYTLPSQPGALHQHAAASDALSILAEQLPVPELPTDPDALMASSVEPGVTADAIVVWVPTSSVPHFAILDDVLGRAVAAARGGRLLGPPTQPEIAEMRAWLCGEVAAQAARAEPTPWRPRFHVRVPLGEQTSRVRLHRTLVASDGPMIATNDASVIVAVTPDMAAFLGYRDVGDLLGRRILVVVPPRYHQAHVAGTTLHATNGRDPLLDHWLTVPVVRADGSEVEVGMRVEERRLHDGLRGFVARFELPPGGSR